MVFDKDAFLKANLNRTDGFSNNIPGDREYFVKLVEASVAPAKSSGRMQMLLKWQIDDDSDECPGQYIYHIQGLQKNDGDANLVGYQIMWDIARQIGVHCELSEFAENPDEHLKRCVNVTARIYKGKDKTGQYDRYKLNQVWDSPYGDTEYNETIVSPVEPGSKVEDIPEEEIPFEKPEQVEQIEQAEPILEIGMNVRGTFGDKVITGEIYAIDGPIIKIRQGNQAFPCGINTVKPLS